ncbi:MAG: 3'-5' exonuclease [Burkholderiaceae bacterium]|nr:MAG: 3'-5' exonuclease [Burkholderiaceae bacterium]TAM06109.1 MAG: 3'-5' exonuclease [Pusillimonas sp.]
MIPSLVFDLETIPDADGLRRLNGSDPALSDVEVVEAALQARRESHGNDFLPLHLHKVAVIGCVFRDDSGFRVKTLGQADDPEATLISGFFKTIERYTPRLISWNGSGFDLPVLHYRSLIHGLQAPRYWDTGEDDRDFKYNNYINRYHSRHIDLMNVLAKYNARANAPLDEMAKLCGFPGKLGMDGGQVWKAWTDGRADEVRGYCETDVVNTWLVYCRYCLLKGELDQAAYAAELELVRGILQASDAPHWKEYMAVWNGA